MLLILAKNSFIVNLYIYIYIYITRYQPFYIEPLVVAISVTSLIFVHFQERNLVPKVFPV
jgi:hypothetical protein